MPRYTPVLKANKKPDFVDRALVFIDWRTKLNKQILTESQVQSSLDMYEAHSPYSFTRVILSIASVLIGLGILTFIASNWEDLTAWFKFILVLIFLALSSFASLATEESYPKTSRSLLYLTVLIFGGGIFLI